MQWDIMESCEESAPGYPANFSGSTDCAQSSSGSVVRLGTPLNTHGVPFSCTCLVHGLDEPCGGQKWNVWRIPRNFSRVQHEVSRLHRHRAVRHVVLSGGTAMFHGILETKTKEQAMMLHTVMIIQLFHSRFARVLCWVQPEALVKLHFIRWPLRLPSAGPVDVRSYGRRPDQPSSSSLARRVCVQSPTSSSFLSSSTPTCTP